MPALQTSIRILAREWRRLATGISFATFMIGSLVLTIFVFPVIRILPTNWEKKRDWNLHLIQNAFALFFNYMRWLGVIKSTRYRGVERLSGEEPYLIVANHPSLIDVVAIIGQVPRCNCVVKKALWRHFYMGGVMRAMDYLPNNSALDLIERARLTFQSGRSLMLFPEGTRSPPGSLGPFGRGAAQIALRTGVKIMPVVLRCDPPTLVKGEPWYAVPPRAMEWELTFMEPIVIPPEIEQIPEMALKARMLTSFLESFFREQLELDTPA